jgi:predicted acetyltransferase
MTYFNGMKVKLARPEMSLAPSYFSFVDEMAAHGEKVWEGFLPSAGESVEQFIARIIISETSPRPGLVPESTYWGVRGGQVVGRISLRHVLNENLAEFGGHIGYEVRPSVRRQGVATSLLKQILETPKAREIGRLLLTCAPDNAASIKTILNNGGVFEKSAYVEKWKRQTQYYWIELKG